MQGMVLADLRDQLDLHGIGQAQQYLQEKLNGHGSAPVKRLLATDTSFREACGHFNPDLCFYARILQKMHMCWLSNLCSISIYVSAQIMPFLPALC